MTKFQKASLRVWLLIAALLLAPIHVLAGDSTSFTRSTVTAVAPSGGAVPVGTVIIWPFTTNPPEWDAGKWLECNGQAITSSAHPELYALGYSTVPDFRERVAWGHTTPRSVRVAGLPNITGYFESKYTGRTDAVSSSGALYSSSSSYQGSHEKYGTATRINFDASRSNSIYGASSTVQPPALTVRFLIRAKS